MFRHEFIVTPRRYDDDDVGGAVPADDDDAGDGAAAAAADASQFKPDVDAADDEEDEPVHDQRSSASVQSSAPDLKMLRFDMMLWKYGVKRGWDDAAAADDAPPLALLACATSFSRFAWLTTSRSTSCSGR